MRSGIKSRTECVIKCTKLFIFCRTPGLSRNCNAGRVGPVLPSTEIVRHAWLLNVKYTIVAAGKTTFELARGRIVRIIFFRELLVCFGIIGMIRARARPQARSVHVFIFRTKQKLVVQLRIPKNTGNVALRWREYGPVHSEGSWNSKNASLLP